MQKEKTGSSNIIFKAKLYDFTIQNRFKRNLPIQNS